MRGRMSLQLSSPESPWAVIRKRAGEACVTAVNVRPLIEIAGMVSCIGGWVLANRREPRTAPSHRLFRQWRYRRSRQTPADTVQPPRRQRPQRPAPRCARNSAMCVEHIGLQHAGRLGKDELQVEFLVPECGHRAAKACIVAVRLVRGRLLALPHPATIAKKGEDGSVAKRVHFHGQGLRKPATGRSQRRCDRP